MSPDRKLAYELEFNTQEREMIEQYARKLATLESTDIDNFAQTRNNLHIMGMQAAASSDPVSSIKQLSAVDHQFRLMNEVIIQARVLQQIAGRDDISVMQKVLSEAGIEMVFNQRTESFDFIKKTD